MSDIRPIPTEDEAVAIVAALDAVWPRASTAAPTDLPTRWRWSGRWWTKPVPLARTRPW